MGIQTEPLSTQSTSVGSDDLPKHSMAVGTCQGTSDDEGSSAEIGDHCKELTLEDIPLKMKGNLPCMIK